MQLIDNKIIDFINRLVELNVIKQNYPSINGSDVYCD